MPVKILVPARRGDASHVASIRNDAADELTRVHGKGHWSRVSTEAAVLREMKTSRVYVLRERTRIVATLRLATQKPWAIDVAYFAASDRPIYLHDMAVAPAKQRSGLGRKCVERAIELARDWDGDAIRLDAYDSAAGAGAFYAKCGFREVGRVKYRKTPLVYFERLLASESDG